MTMFSALSFTSPFLLIALISLPALWLVLRVTPPRPARIPFPPLVLVRKWMREESAPAKIPLWILILRLLIAAALILAMAGPVYAPEKARIVGNGPLAIYVETGWPAAENWELRSRILTNLVKEAEAAQRPILLFTSNDILGRTDLVTPAAALEKLRAISPHSYRPSRTEALARLSARLQSLSDADIVLAFDGLADDHDAKDIAALAQAIGPRKVFILQSDASKLLVIAGVENSAEGLKLRILRSSAGAERIGELMAYDMKGRNLGETSFRFDQGELEHQATMKLPSEIRNEIAKVEIAANTTAGAVQLIDASQRRHRIGLVSGLSTDIAQPLLTPDYYLARALEMRADLREPKQGIAESISTLLDENVSILILADIGTLPANIETRLKSYVDAGGMLIRFAGPKLANANTTLLPVRLRGTGRALQGALSWESPQKLNAFESGSPFFGLPVPDDVTVTRQLLAEPDADLAKKTWAALSDGTPIVTAEKRGKGLLILFHVTADTSWSSLPLSGLYLSMFDRLLPLATGNTIESNVIDQTTPLQPLRILDGFGHFIAPAATTKPAQASQRKIASADHPAGFYGDSSAPFAINSADEKTNLRLLNISTLNGEIIPLEEPKKIDFMPPLILIAAVLLALDGLASLIRGRGLTLIARLRGNPIAVLTLFIVLAHSSNIWAASLDTTPKEAEAALRTRLAYVLTGNSNVDETSRQGLEGLSLILSERTSFEPGEPVGVDLKSDDLAVYPLLYWPITETQSVPPQDAIRRIDRFMKNGGTIIFDTRDAALSRDGDITPETRNLRLILAGLSIPPLEPLPQDHVLTKAFYLIDRIVGRTANGQTWLEALPKSNENEGPARAGDGVTPIIITSNDLAAAWAIDQRGGALLPMDISIPRQREMALRGGVNIVMYVLTGNYKSDQVHIPALLERLGQ